MSDEQDYQDYLDYQEYLKSQGSSAPAEAPKTPVTSDILAGGISQFMPFGAQALAGVATAADKLGVTGQDADYSRRLEQARTAQKMYNENSPDSGVGESILGNAWLPIKKLAPGAGLLKRLANLEAHGAGYGALFGLAGDDGSLSDKLGSAGEGAVRGLEYTPLLAAPFAAAGLGARAVGKLSEKFLPGPAAEIPAGDPQTTRALQLAQRMGPGDNGFLNKPADEIAASGKLDTGGAQAIDLVNAKAQNLHDSIAAQLGSDGGQTSEDIALAKQFDKAGPELVKSGIYEKSGNVNELLANAKDRDGQINNERKVASQELDDATRNLNAKWLRQESLPGSEFTQKPTSLPGTITANTPEIQTAVAELDARISKLNQTELAEPIAKGLQETKDSVLRDLQPTLEDQKNPGAAPKWKLISPKQVVEKIQNLNEVRRKLQREFDSNTVASREKGNTPNSDLGASIEAVGTLQKALQDSLGRAVNEINAKAGTKIDPELFNSLNSEQSAMKSVQDLGAKFQRGTAEARSVKSPTRIQQNANATTTRSLFTPTSARSMAEFADSAVSKARGLPNDALKSAQAVESREGDALKNINDLISLNKNPAKYNPLPPKQSVFTRLGRGATALSAFAPLAVGAGSAGPPSVFTPPSKGSPMSFNDINPLAISEAHADLPPTEPLPPGARFRTTTRTTTDHPIEHSGAKFREDHRRLYDLGLGAEPTERLTSKITPKLLDAVRQVESSGGKNNLGPDTKYGRAEGPYQLIEKFAKPYHSKLGLSGEYDPYNEKQSRKIASAMLEDNLKWTNGDLVDAVTAYHSGIKNVRQKKLGPEGRAYAKRVFTVFRKA